MISRYPRVSISVPDVIPEYAFDNSNFDARLGDRKETFCKMAKQYGINLFEFYFDT
jgi:hypothetical protein